MGYLGSSWVEGFWFGWFYVVNQGFVVRVQGAKWEGLVGARFLLRPVMWVV